MGQRGPLPKPTATRAREGNPRRRPLPTNEPTPPLVAAKKLPTPPDHLDALGQKVFTTLARILTDADLLTVADIMPLEMLADSYSQWIAALALRKKAGVIVEVFKDGEVINTFESPESKLCRNLAADCNRWFKVLGLGPAYRVGLRTSMDAGDEIDDPLAAAIANG
jgi:P27 family predicted phage terminase small subunit